MPILKSPTEILQQRTSQDLVAGSRRMLLQVGNAKQAEEEWLGRQRYALFFLLAMARAPTHRADPGSFTR